MSTRGRPVVYEDERHARMRERYAGDHAFREARRRASRKWASRKRAAFTAWRDTQRCAVCGEDRGYTLDFHHVHGRDNQKSTILAFSTDSAEFLKRCSESVILCANCHRWAHHLRENDPASYDDEVATLKRVVPPCGIDQGD